jgi:anti-anti-sigma factor
MRKIKISVPENNPEDEISVVNIEGVIDTMNVSELEKILDSLTSGRRVNLIINLASVEYISSAGWSALISRATLLRENGVDLKLVNLTPNIFETFEMFEFDKILKVYDNLESARTSCMSPGKAVSK